MKKRSLKNLLLSKRSIANFEQRIHGGLHSGNPSGGTDQNPNSMDILQCSPETFIANTDCTCA
ncbi:MAG: hypothetical protein AAF611_10385 [Bacteroidota bacterium]